MSLIAIAATSPCYVGSLGAMVDAHARLGELFESNEALGDFSRMQTTLRLTGAVKGPIILAGGRQLMPDANLSILDLPRLIYLPSFQLPEPDRYFDLKWEYAELYGWLGRQAAQGVRIGASGNSVLHLAACGLLGGGVCAASPRLVGILRKLSPRTRIDTDASIRQEGPLWTCSRDADNPAFVVRLLAEVFSPTLGQYLATREPPDQSVSGTAARAADPIVAQAQLWIGDNFTKHFRIADLARDLGISHQALIRRFAAAGLPAPRQTVQRARINAAATMLVETNRSVSEIAQLVGYADIPSFRQKFHELTGQTPSHYRRSGRKARR